MQLFPLLIIKEINAIAIPIWTSKENELGIEAVILLGYSICILFAFYLVIDFKIDMKYLVFG